MPSLLCPLRQSALAFPKNPCIKTPSITWSYSQIDHWANQIGEKLLSLNLQKQDRIAIYHPTDPALIPLFFAAFRLNLTICPINTRLPIEQVEEQIKTLSPKIVISSSPLSQKTLSLKEVTSHLPPSSQMLENLEQEDIATLLATSGTTKKPKLAALSIGNHYYNALGSIKTLDLTPQDCYLLSLPLFHVSGISVLFRSFLSGSSIYISHEKTSPYKKEISHLSMVSTQLYRLLQDPSFTRENLSLKCLLLGGGPISLSHYKKALERKLPIFLTYGLTEMGSQVITSKHPTVENNQIYLKSPLPFREIKVAPDGEILVKGACLFKGYWEKGKLELPLQDSWFATNDVGKFDEKLGLTILGRKDHLFISGGENINPEEIEEILESFEGVIEAIVVPCKDEEFGYRPFAYIQTKEKQLLEKAIKAKLGKLLPKYKIPSRYLFLSNWENKERIYLADKIESSRLF